MKTLFLCFTLSLWPLNTFASGEVALLNAKNSKNTSESSEMDSAIEPSTGSSGTPTTLNGIKVRKNASRDSNVVKMLFLFSKEEESEFTYFRYYDKKKKALVIDIYNKDLGAAVLETLRKTSSIKSDVEEFQVDLNQEVSGLKPDVRNVIRLILYLKKPSIRELESDEGLALDLSWKKTKRPDWKSFLPYL